MTILAQLSNLPLTEFVQNIYFTSKYSELMYFLNVLIMLNIDYYFTHK